MSIRPISEKTEEMLFTRYILQSFGLGNMSLVAPSSVEEFVQGYNVKLFGAKSFN